MSSSLCSSFLSRCLVVSSGIVVTRAGDLSDEVGSVCQKVMAFGFLIGFGRASREGEGSWAGLGSGSPGVAG